MKGKTLTEIAKELEYIRAGSKDYKVQTMALNMEEDGNISFAGTKVKPTSWAHQQIASYTDIPKAYYDRLKAENPSLLSDNVNHGFSKGAAQQDTRLLRTVNGSLRGFLSSRYRRLDSYDLLNNTLPVLRDSQFEFVNAEVTEKRFYLKTTLPRMQAEVKKGDVVQWGIMLSNSDVGAGSLRIEPFITRLVCMNGMVMDSSIKKYHVGRENGGDSIFEILSDEANEATDKAFWLQVRDTLIHSMKPEVFNNAVAKMVQSTGVQITNYNLERVVEMASNLVGIKDKGIRENLVAQLATGNEGAGLTLWGLANSFTAVAKRDEIDYETGVELERAGSLILNVTPNQWRQINAA